MPCTYDDGNYNNYSYTASLVEKNNFLKKELKNLTQMLCASCQKLEKNKITIPKNTVSWWQEHKKFDKKRKNVKKIKKK